MRVRGWCLAMLAGALFAAVAHAEEPQAQAQPAAQQGMPDWVPGPLANDRQEPAPGRVAARNLGLAFTLPEAWRAADVSWRELDATEAQAINSLAEAGLIVELAGKGDDKQRLLTLYRVPLEGWREADRVGKAGPGRITLNSSDKGYVVVRPADADKAGRYATLRGSVEDAIGTNYELRGTESVGPKIGDELMRSGIWAVIATMVAIAIYVWVRFEWQFAVGALIAMLHDVISTIGIFVLFQLDFSLTALAAVLTIAGYSINDTVVIFDRVRENMRRYKKMPLLDLLNQSINETLARTMMTSGTVFVAVGALVLFGGPVLHSFSIAMLWGVIVGTYSSVWVACAGLVYLGLRADQLRPTEDKADKADKTEQAGA